MEIKFGEWISIVDYTRIHQISDMTVRRRIRSGMIQSQKVDGKYYVKNDSSVVPTPSNHSPTLPSLGKHFATTFEPQVPISRTVPSHHEGQDEFALLADSTLSNAPNQNEFFALLEVALKELSEQKLLYKDQEESVKAFYLEKIKRLEKELSHKDLIISQLNRDTQDLQSLLKLLDQKLAQG